MDKVSGGEQQIVEMRKYGKAFGWAVHFVFCLLLLMSGGGSPFLPAYSRR